MPLIGNKVIEKDLRGYLTEQGYCGETAQFASLELAAIQRPGWLQVFTFEVRVKEIHTSDWKELLGVCRDDERFDQFDVVLNEDHSVRDAKFNEWSADLIRHDCPAARHWLRTVLLVIFLAIFAGVGVAALTGLIDQLNSR